MNKRRKHGIPSTNLSDQFNIAWGDVMKIVFNQLDWDLRQFPLCDPTNTVDRARHHVLIRKHIYGIVVRL